MKWADLPGQPPELSLSLSQKKKKYVPGPGPAGIWILATVKKESSSVPAMLHKAMAILLAAKIVYPIFI